MTTVIVLVGAGSIGQAIARRVCAVKHILLADLRQENASAAAKTLSEAGFQASTATVDVASRASVPKGTGGILHRDGADRPHCPGAGAIPRHRRPRDFRARRAVGLAYPSAGSNPDRHAR